MTSLRTTGPWVLTIGACLAASGVLPHTAMRVARAAVPAEVLAAQQRRIDVVQQVSPSVVAIFSSSGDGGGSGVLISRDGYALSNFHVTSGAGNFMKCGLNDGRLYDAVIVGVDPTGDVALLRLLGRDDFPVATMGDSDRVRTGEEVFAIGNPFLLATDFTPTVTFGIVSGVHRYQYPAGTILEYTDCLQTDASINPGNSGGPLFALDGTLVGINGRGSFEKRGRVNSGAGYAISINQIRHFLDHLRSGRIVDHGTLGALVRSGADREVLVDQILEQSPAYRRGLREGDEIVSFAGRAIGSVNQFKNILGIYPSGWTLPLVYRRDGVKNEIAVELRPLHTARELAEATQSPEQHPGDQPQPKEPPPNEQQPEAPQPPGAPGADPQPPGGPAPDAPEKPGVPHPLLPQAAVTAIPEQYRHLFESKSGFANYYFNRLEQERVLRGLARLGSWRDESRRWKLSGRVLLPGAPAEAAPSSFSMILTEAAVGLSVGQTGRYFQPVEMSDPIDEPRGSGGLLIAWHHLRLLLTQGPEAFTDCYYFGSEPLTGFGDAGAMPVPAADVDRAQMVDVLITERAGVSTRWYFRQSDGEFVGFSSLLSPELDPAEVRFLEFRPFGGLLWPGRFTVRSGERSFGEFVLENAELGAAATPREATP